MAIRGFIQLTPKGTVECMVNHQMIPSSSQGNLVIPMAAQSRIDERDMIETIQKIVKLYADAKSKDKTLSHLNFLKT